MEGSALAMAAPMDTQAMTNISTGMDSLMVVDLDLVMDLMATTKLFDECKVIN